jgi:hypothetical protein
MRYVLQRFVTQLGARDEEFMSVGFLVLKRSLEDICLARTAPDGGDC